MNLTYLKNELLPQRQKEIIAGMNSCTSNPIYVVLDIVEHVIDGHNNSFTLPETLSERKQEYGYIDLKLDDEREFKKDDFGMEEPYPVTRFWTDRFVAFFLTRKSAEEYLVYQSHNLSDGYVYVFNAGYRNKEMDNLLKNNDKVFDDCEDKRNLEFLKEMKSRMIKWINNKDITQQEYVMSMVDDWITELDSKIK